MIRFRSNGIPIGNSYGAGSGPIWIDDIRCSSNDTSIHSCEKPSWGLTNCGHNEDISIRCLEEADASGSALDTNSTQSSIPEISELFCAHNIFKMPVFGELLKKVLYI